MPSRVFEALQQLRVMRLYEMESGVHEMTTGVALDDELGPLEEQRALGRVFGGGDLIQPAVQILGKSHVDGHNAWYQSGTTPVAL